MNACRLQVAKIEYVLNLQTMEYVGDISQVFSTITQPNRVKDSSMEDVVVMETDFQPKRHVRKHVKVLLL